MGRHIGNDSFQNESKKKKSDRSGCKARTRMQKQKGVHIQAVKYKSKCIADSAALH